MLTWLDEWCEGMAQRRIQLLAQNGQGRDRFCNNDGLAAREATRDALRKQMHLEDNDAPVHQVIAFLALFAPFFASPGMLPSVRAYQITRELVARLKRPALDRDAIAKTRAMIKSTDSVYIDVPSGLVPVGDNSELRAIFVQWVTLPNERGVGENAQHYDILRYCAVVTPRGQYGWRYAMWTDDRSQWVCDNVSSDDFSLDDPIRAEVSAMPTFDDILRQARKARAELQDIVEWTAHVVLNHAQDPARVRVERLQYLAYDSDRRKRGHGVNVAQRYSLFRVERLNLVDPEDEAQAPPAVNARAAEEAEPQEMGEVEAQPAPGAQAQAGQDVDAEQAPEAEVQNPGAAPQNAAGQRRGWELDRRITVKGHTRRQRYGPRELGQTREIEIKEHEKGPRDALPIHPIRPV